MFFLINKPQGISSFEAIKKFSKKYNIKKIGHTGTLDPLATGALLVATDFDTKLIPYIDKGSKTYVARAMIGYSSNSWDITNDYKKLILEKQIHFNDVKLILKSMIGDFHQQPPIFSAKKIQGQRAYKLARSNKTFILPKNKVEIYDIKKIKKINKREYEFMIIVSRGTYIRSVIHELGLKLNTRAIMSKLNRIKLGNLKVSKSYKKVNIKKIIKYPIIKYNNPKILLKNKFIFINYKDGIYALMYKKDIFAIGEINNKIFHCQRLFGNKLVKYLDKIGH